MASILDLDPELELSSTSEQLARHGARVSQSHYLPLGTIPPYAGE
jgi:hypothetical protein